MLFLRRICIFCCRSYHINDEKRYKACNENDFELNRLLMEYQSVVFALEENISRGKVEGQIIKDLIVLFEQVVDQVAKNYEKVGKEVAEIIDNGHFWLESDRVKEEGGWYSLR